MPFTVVITLFSLIALSLGVVAFMRGSTRLALMAGGAFVMSVVFALAVIIQCRAHVAYLRLLRDRGRSNKGTQQNATS